MGVRGNWAGEAEAFTEAEYTVASELLDDFFVTVNASAPSRIHLTRDCQMLTRANTSGSVTRKDPEVFPYGSREVCRYCVVGWRECWRLVFAAMALDGVSG